MVKLNLIRFSALFLACFMVSAVSNAQTVIWGVGSSNAASIPEAEFSNAFVQAGTFTAGDNPNSWTALSVSDNNGTPGAAYWVRNTTGYSAGAYWGGTTPVSSPSQANGVAIFDSDFLDNGGTPGNFGQGTSPASQRGELISPRIDLTGYSNTALAVRAFAFYRNFRIGTLGFGISTDDGATWTEADFRGTLPNSTQGIASSVFRSATNNVTNLTQCRIKVIFDGNYYFAIVDDIRIETALQYDAAIGTGNNDNSLTILNRGDFVKPGGSRHLAYENLDPTDLREWFFGAKVVNFGSRSILPTDNPRLQIAIDYVDDLTGAVTPDVYRDSIAYDTIPAGDPVGYTDIKYFNDIQFIMNHKAGDYRVKYWLSYDATEGDPSNDTAQYVFTVTDEDIPTPGVYTKNFISQTGRSADGGVGFRSAIFPGGPDPFAQFEYGTVYYFPRGMTDSIKIDSVSYRYRLTGGFTGAANQTLFLHLYEVDASRGTVDANALTQIGIAPINLTGLGTTIPVNTYNLTTITNILSAGTGPLPALKDNGFYLVSIVTNPGLSGGAATFGSNDVPWVGAANNINYNQNAAMTRADSMINPSPLSTIDAQGAVTWNWLGFGADDVPAIGLYISSKDPKINTQIVNTVKGENLNVFPNPTNDVLNIEFSMEKADDVMYIINDVTGRVVDIQNVTNVTTDVRTINVNNYPAGTYFITARTSKGTSTQRFTVR